MRGNEIVKSLDCKSGSDSAASVRGAGKEIPTQGQILLGVFGVLEEAGIRYCVLHGYQEYPRSIPSDVDCVVDSRTGPRELAALLHRHRARIGAEIVQCRGYHIVLAGNNPDGSPCFLTLDFSRDCELDDVRFCSGTEILKSRRRHDAFWVPAPGLAFACYLARTIAKGTLDRQRAEWLSALYREDPAGSEQQSQRLWGKRDVELLATAARSGNWEAAHSQRVHLLNALRHRDRLGSLARSVANTVHRLRDRVARLCRPDGVYLVLLGPDGAGKSTLTEILGPQLASILPHTTSYGFAPDFMQNLLHGRNRRTDQPHTLPPRSWTASVLRATLYWFAYYTLGYLVRHVDMARSRLVLADRHYIDVLLDQRRYRYGGPLWLLHLIWRVIPKPDLVVLLDAPSEVLVARKKELPVEEIERQRQGYLKLVRSQNNGHVINVDQPMQGVVNDVCELVLRHLQERTARRMRLSPLAHVGRFGRNAAQVTNS